jgi:hypothetical protein
MTKSFEITEDQINTLNAIGFKIDSLSRVLELDHLGDSEEEVIAEWSKGAFGSVVSNLSRIIQAIIGDLFDTLSKIEGNQKEAPTIPDKAEAGA